MGSAVLFKIRQYFSAVTKKWFAQYTYCQILLHNI